MNTECNVEQLEFHGLGRREVIGKFDGGNISSDGGGVLLRETEQRTHILKRLSHCFTDHRNQDLIEHTLEALVKQRVLGLALGYEDLNDHDNLRQDALLALLSDKADLQGAERYREQDKGKALAGKSTLNRLELTPAVPTKRVATKRSSPIPSPWTNCWSIILSNPTRTHRQRSYWMSMRPMIPCMEIKRDASFTVITRTTVISRYTYSVASTYCVRG
jgi:hypothetical protein